MEYEGQIPSIQFFEPAQMNKEKKEECETWHEEQVSKGVVWNFQTEMLEYCKSDVKLMKEGCLKLSPTDITRVYRKTTNCQNQAVKSVKNAKPQKHKLIKEHN